MRQSQSACLFPHLRRSSMSILDALLSKWPTSVRTLSTSSEIEVPLLTGWCRWASVGGYEKAPSKRRMGYTISWALSHVLLFCSSIFITPLAWILPRTVLLGREKMTRFIPSNSSNLHQLLFSLLFLLNFIECSALVFPHLLAFLLCLFDLDFLELVVSSLQVFSARESPRSHYLWNKLVFARFTCSITKQHGFQSTDGCLGHF